MLLSILEIDLRSRLYLPLFLVSRDQSDCPRLGSQFLTLSLIKLDQSDIL